MVDETILIVDDNLINLKLVRVLLSIEGYKVHTARDANEALTLLQEFKPRLILMDLQLPGMDGLTLTRQLKADPQYQAIPVIAITAYAMKGDEKKALAAGCQGYITKPIDAQELIRVVAQYLQSNKRAS